MESSLEMPRGPELRTPTLDHGRKQRETPESDGPAVAGLIPVNQTPTTGSNEGTFGGVGTTRSGASGVGRQAGAGEPRAPRQRGLGTSARIAGENSSKRRERARLRRIAGEVAEAAWLSSCGRKAVRAGGTVGVRGVQGGPAGFSGIDTCGSWAACPVCAAKIGAERAKEVSDVLDWAARQGHTIAMLTLTARHNRGQRLADLWDGLGVAWRHLGKGWGSESDAAVAKREGELVQRWIDHAEQMRTWREDLEEWRERLVPVGPQRRRPRKPQEPRAFSPRRIGLAERHGLLGYVRATEATYGEAGWHVHYHVVMVLDSDVLPHGAEDRDDALDEFRRGIFDLWQAGLAKSGLTAVSSVKEKDGTVSKVGADLRVMGGENVAKELAAYVAKMTDAIAGGHVTEGKGKAAIAKARARADAELRDTGKQAKSVAGEATLGQFKKGRKGNRAPFEVLQSVADDGDADDAAIWQEWTRVSRGKRQMWWSKGLKEMAGIAADERTDEEIAGEEYGDVDALILPRPTWLAIRDSETRWDVLEAMERGGKDAAARVLSREGLDFILCDDEGNPDHCRDRADEVCWRCRRIVDDHAEHPHG